MAANLFDDNFSWNSHKVDVNDVAWFYLQLSEQSKNPGCPLRSITGSMLAVSYGCLVEKVCGFDDK